MIADWAFPAFCAGCFAAAAWILRDEGWRRSAAFVGIGIAALFLRPLSHAAELVAGKRGLQPVASAPANPAAVPGGRILFSVARCGGAVEPSAGPLLAAAPPQESFMLSFADGNYFPGCGPVAIAAVCGGYRLPAALPRREIQIEVGGAAADWPLGGGRYDYGRSAAPAELVTDIGALSRTSFRREAPGSLTTLRGIEDALDALGFAWAAASGPGEVAASMAAQKPALLLVEGLTEGCAHVVVADGVGRGAGGRTALHLRFCLRGVEDGWFFVQTGADAASGYPVSTALVGISPTCGGALWPPQVATPAPDGLRPHPLSESPSPSRSPAVDGPGVPGSRPPP